MFRFQDGLNVQLAYQVDLDINQLLLDSARSTDEVDSPALKAASAVQEWNSWTQGLGDKLEDVANEVDGLTALKDPKGETKAESKPGKKATSGNTSNSTEKSSPKKDKGDSQANAKKPTAPAKS